MVDPLGEHEGAVARPECARRVIYVDADDLQRTPVQEAPQLGWERTPRESARVTRKDFARAGLARDARQRRQPSRHRVELSRVAGPEGVAHVVRGGGVLGQDADQPGVPSGVALPARELESAALADRGVDVVEVRVPSQLFAGGQERRPPHGALG